MLTVCLSVENVYQDSFKAALERRLPPSPEPRWQDIDREERSRFSSESSETRPIYEHPRPPKIKF